VNSKFNLSLWIAFGIIVFGLAVLCIFVFIFYYRAITASKLIGPLIQSNAPDKRYIVIEEYVPIASDEIRLKLGDVVVLDMLFNDGWAKVLPNL
jgi:hypothetical protein